MSHAKTTRSYARSQAAWAIRDLARKQKHVAHAFGIDQSNVSRQANGEQDGDVSRFYLRVQQAVEARQVRRAGSLIAGAEAAAQEAAEGLSEEECRAALDLAHEVETRAQHAEDVCQHRVLRALAKTETKGATEADWYELADAISDHEGAIRAEQAAHSDVIYFARGLVAVSRRAH